MRGSIVRAFALGIITGSFLTAGTVLAAKSHADGYLDADEEAYVQAWGEHICEALTDRPTVNGLLAVADIVFGDGYRPDEVADIVNGAVVTQCPQHWPLLVAVGRAAREQNGGIL